MTTQVTGIIKTRKKSTRRSGVLYTFSEIALRQKALASSVGAARGKGRRKKQVKRSMGQRIWRVFMWSALVFLTLLLLLAGGLAYITSPAAEQVFTRFVTQAINTAGESMGLRVYIGSIGGFWHGEIRVLNLRVHDAYGPWLYVEEGTLHPSWKSIAQGVRATVQAQRGRDITVRDYEIPLQSSVVTGAENYEVDTESVQQEYAAPSTVPGVTSADNGTVADTADIMDNLLEPQGVLTGKVVIALQSGTLIGVRMPRLPRYAVSDEADVPDIEAQAFAPLSFLPWWLAFDIGELELSDFLLGPVGKNAYISGRFHGQINNSSVRVRSTIMLEKDRPKQWALPATQDLPGDVTLTYKAAQALGGTAASSGLQSLRGIGDKKLIAFLSLDLKGADFDMRWRIRDAFITPYYLSGIKRIWSRLRLLGHIPSWPPTQQSPLHVSMASRFGSTLVSNALNGKERKIKASMASGQALWDGERLVLRDMNLVSPIKEPMLNFSASLGVAQEEGLGIVVRMGVKDMRPVARIFGAEFDYNDLQGSLNVTFTAMRGGEHVMWWTKPLPPVQKGRELPGFTPTPKDFSQLGKHLGTVAVHLRNTLATIAQRNDITLINKETRLPEPSGAASAMKVQLRLESPALTLPGGSIEDVYINIRGTSVEAKDSPSGTGQEKTPTGKKFVADFSKSGIPQGLVGHTRIRIGDIYSMGTGYLEGNWFLGGLHEKASVFLADLEDFTLTLPGMSGRADMGFAYALPIVKRRWPWMDGNFTINVEHWRLLSRLLHSPLRGDGVKLASELKSFLDTNGKPQQYFIADLQAQRLDATQFMVQDVQGLIESKYVHALADVLALAVGPLREAMKKKLDYHVPEGAELLTSQLQLANGRSGSFRWNWGTYRGHVQDEDARFSIQMDGDIDASLDGSFNFRKRVLRVGQMQLKTLKQ